jgi:c(7)-type cytochrome triheme protein
MTVGATRRWLGLAVLLVAPSVSRGMEIVPAYRYGLVEMSSRSFAAKVPPVSFDHWRHRARFTCRLCHVDVGFAMTAGQTEISASTNRSGYHCGACHNGKTTVSGTPIFASCSAGQDVDEAPRCRRCHASRDAAKVQKDYELFAARFPKKGLGRGIDWEEAESKGLIRPIDYMEGVSIRRTPLKMDKEIVIQSTGWMTNALFSHQKHSVWNGCEVCHPEIYPSTKSGTKKTSMIEISSGQSCGVCHTKVAFQIAECQRCHVTPVR